MLNIVPELNKQLLRISNYFWVQNYQHYISWLDKLINYCKQTWLLECRNDFCRNVLPNMLLLGQTAVLVVKKTLQNFYQCSIYNILRWVAWTMGQTNHRPRVWCSKYYFFFNSYRLRALKTLYFYFCKSMKEIEKKLNQFLQRILKGILKNNNNTWNIRSFVAESKNSVSYCRLSDLWCWSWEK